MRRKALCLLGVAVLLCATAWAADKPKPKDQDKAKESPKMEELISKGDYQGAVDLAKKFVAANQANEGIYIDLGLAYQKLKDYPNAIAAYEEAIKLNPASAAAFKNEASCYQDQNEPAKVAETLKRAVDADPKNLELRYTLAAIYEKLENPDDASAQYEEIFKADPSFKDVAYAAGLICYNKKLYDKAEPYFDKAVAVTPHDDQVLLAQVQNFVMGKKYDKAIPALKSFIETTKNETYKATATQNVAGIYMKQGDAIQAGVKDLRDKAKPTADDKAKIAEADAASKPAYTSAIEYYDKVLVLRPNSETALEGKARALIMLDRAQEALPLLKKYMEVSKREDEKKKVAETIKTIEGSKKK